MRSKEGSVTVGGLGRAVYLIQKGLKNWWGRGGTPPASAPGEPLSPTCAPSRIPSTPPTNSPLPPVVNEAPTVASRASAAVFDVGYHSYILYRMVRGIINTNEDYILENKVKSICLLGCLTIGGSLFIGAKLIQKVSSFGFGPPAGSIVSILHSLYQITASALVSWWRWKETLERENARLRWENEGFRAYFIRMRESELSRPQ